MQSNILIVDDDTALAIDLEAALRTAGHRPRRAANVPDARAAWAEARADLCLVDIRMPGPSGKVFCREIRERSDAAIIMMSSLSDADTIIALLDIGADDYITKPFSMPEMMARIRAVMRRRSAKVAPPTSPEIRIGAWHFDVRLRRLSKPEGLAVPLTQGEASVLRFLSQSPGVVFSREDLLAVARTRQHAGKDDRAVDALVMRLRKKVEPNPSEPVHILTEWGKGYRFQP